MSSPLLEMNDGRSIPQIGFGSAFFDPTGGLDSAALVREAIEVGYRHIDTAKAYRNEAEVGEGLRTAGIAREELFVTSKLWDDEQGYPAAKDGLKACLERMGLDYLDLFLIHWPNPALGLYVDTWRALIECREEGLVRSIGVSNFEPDHVDRLIEETGVAPAVNQVELNPTFQQRPLRAAMQERGVLIECWSPLVSGLLLDDSTYDDITAKHERTTAQVILRWHLQNGLVIIPKSERRDWMEQNLAIVDFELDDNDMARIGALDQGEAGRSTPHPDVCDVASRIASVGALIEQVMARQTRMQ